MLQNGTKWEPASAKSLDGSVMTHDNQTPQPSITRAILSFPFLCRTGLVLLDEMNSRSRYKSDRRLLIPRKKEDNIVRNASYGRADTWHIRCTSERSS